MSLEHYPPLEQLASVGCSFIMFKVKIIISHILSILPISLMPSQFPFYFLLIHRKISLLKPLTGIYIHGIL